MGPLIAKALIELGYREPPTVQLSRVAKIVTEKTGKKLTKQRLSAILKAETITPETLDWIARGLGLTTTELVTGKIQKRPGESVDV